MGHANVVNALIQYGASPDSESAKGETPLHLGAMNNHPEVVSTLLNNGSQVDIKGYVSRILNLIYKKIPQTSNDYQFIFTLSMGVHRNFCNGSLGEQMLVF